MGSNTEHNCHQQKWDEPLLATELSFIVFGLKAIPHLVYSYK